MGKENLLTKVFNSVFRQKNAPFNITGLNNPPIIGDTMTIQQIGLGSGQSFLLKDSFGANADIYSIITSIASEVISVGFDVKINGEITESGLSYDIINNTTEPFNLTMEKAMINLLATGEVFFEKVIAEGFSTPSRLEVLRSASVEIDTNSLNEPVNYRYHENGRYRNISPDEILHIKEYNPIDDGEGNNRGFNRLVAGNNVLRASNSRELATASYHENLGASGLVTDRSGSLRDENEKKSVQQAFDRKLGGANKTGRYVVTSADLAVNTLGMSPKDLELTKSSPLHTRRLASLYHVSSRPFNDPEGSTYNNATTDNKDFFVRGVKKPLEKILIGISQYTKEIDGAMIVPDYSKIEVLQADQLKETEKNTKQSDAVIKVITSPISADQKVFILVNTWGMDEEEAKTLVGDGTNGQEENTGNQGAGQEEVQ